MRNREHDLSIIREYMVHIGKPVGPKVIYDSTKIPKTTVHRCLQYMLNSGQASSGSDGKYTLVLPDIERRLLDNWMDFSSIAYAPFAPVIAGAHAVLQGKPALVLPINAYVGVGVKELDSKGGKVSIMKDPVVQFGNRSSVSIGEIEKSLGSLTDKACKETGLPRDRLPNYLVETYSTIDISSGLGGSGALAAAIARCFFSATGRLQDKNPLKEGSADFNRVFSLAYKMEEHIHGKRVDEEGGGPFSSGASVLGALLGNPGGRVYRYRVTNTKDIIKDPKTIPIYEYTGLPISLDLSDFSLVQGNPKETREALIHMRDMLNRLADFQELIRKYFDVWEVLVKDLEIALTQKKEQTAELLKFQNSLYFSLGLGDERFAKLSEIVSMIDGVGGSIVGGGKGGAFLIYCSKSDNKRQLDSALLGQRVLNNMFNVFNPCVGAKVLK